jgi:alpha-amylase
MSTKFFSDGDVHAYFNPYETPYEAFINYMNVLSDFSIRLNAAVPYSSEEKELANLAGILEEKNTKIRKLEAELHKLRSRRRNSSIKKEPDGKSVAKTQTAGVQTKSGTKNKSVIHKTTDKKKSVAKRSAVKKGKDSK